MLEPLPGISAFTIEQKADDLCRVTLTPRENTDARSEIFFSFAHAQIALLEIRQKKASLEDIFLELTQENIQDAPPDKAPDQKDEKEGEPA